MCEGKSLTQVTFVSVHICKMNALDSPILNVPSQPGILGLCLPEVLNLILVYPDCIESNFAQQPRELWGNWIPQVIQWTQLHTWPFPRDQTWGPHTGHWVTSVSLLTFLHVQSLTFYVSPKKINLVKEETVLDRVLGDRMHLLPPTSLSATLKFSPRPPFGRIGVTSPAQYDNVWEPSRHLHTDSPRCPTPRWLCL